MYVPSEINAHIENQSSNNDLSISLLLIKSKCTTMYMLPGLNTDSDRFGYNSNSVLSSNKLRCMGKEKQIVCSSARVVFL